MPYIIFLLLIFGAGAGFGANINIGEEFYLQGISINNADYQKEQSDHNDFYANQLRFYLEGELDKGVTVNLKLQSLGIWGQPYASTQTVVGLPNQSFTNISPFVENAFIQLNSMLGSPLTFTFGRQPFRYGDGLILDDDGFGFEAWRLDLRWPKSFLWTAIGIKSSESSGSQAAGEKDSDVYGLIAEYRLNQNYRLGTYYVTEKDKHRNDRNQNFIGLRIEGNLEKGAFYKGEYVQQTGEDNTATGRIENKGTALLFGGGFITDTAGLGKTVINIDYAVGSGDDTGTPNINEAFSPGFGHRRRGVSRAGYGEYYAASLSDVYGGLPTGSSGVQTMGFNLAISPFTPALTLSGSYYNYKAGKISANPSNELGDEIDLSSKFEYSENITLRFIYAVFAPGKGTKIDGANAVKILAEASARF